MRSDPLRQALGVLRARLKGGWREEDHPRDESGKFGEGGGGGGSEKPKVPHVDFSFAGQNVSVPKYGSKDGEDLPRGPELLKAVAALERLPKYRAGAVPLRAAFEAMREAASGLSLEQFHRQLIFWQNNDLAILKVTNDPSLLSAEDARHAFAREKPGGGVGMVAFLETNYEGKSRLPALLKRLRALKHGESAARPLRGGRRAGDRLARGGPGTDHGEG